MEARRKKYKQRYYEKNIDYQNRWQKEKYKTDPFFILNKNISRSIRHSLKGNKNGYHWEYLIGCHLQELIEHLESTSEFTIQDYLEQNLHIDHIIPVSLYDFNTYKDKEFKKCWNIRNLRLTTAKENLFKKDKLDMELIKKYEVLDLLPKRN